jgi:hypothetical protein
LSLDTLSPLPSLESSLPSLDKFATTAIDTAKDAALGSLLPPILQPLGWLGFNKTTIVMVIVGLLLIAAGIFSFDKTRELVVTTGKHVGKAAELAAAA